MTLVSPGIPLGSDPLQQCPAPGHEIDARPVLPAHAASLWGRVSEERDRVHDTILDLMRQRRTEALVLRSNPDIYPANVEWECWQRTYGATERIRLVLTIMPQPQRRHEIVYDLMIADRGRRTRHLRLRALEREMLEQIVTSLMNNQRLPRFPAARLRCKPYELWLPRNRLTGVRTDALGWMIRMVVAAAAGLALFGPTGGWLMEGLYNLRLNADNFLYSIFGFNLYSLFLQVPVLATLLLAGAILLKVKVKNPWIGWPAVITASVLAFTFELGGWAIEGWSRIAGALFGPFGLWPESSGFAMPLVLVAGVAAALLAIVRNRRLRTVYNPGRPLVDPRMLRLADYWHVVLPSLGGDVARAQNDFVDEVRRHTPSQLSVRIETIAFRGAEGKEERDQVVLSFRRGLVFCHFYAYGEDLYVGWDAYLNRGKWVEVTLARGVSRESGRPVIVNSVQPGHDRLCEYDIVDLNCLIEWTHSVLTRLVKRIAKEHRIDEEIDFTIQRAERHRLMQRDENENRGAGLAARGRRMMQRVG